MITCDFIKQKEQIDLQWHDNAGNVSDMHTQIVDLIVNQYVQLHMALHIDIMPQIKVDMDVIKFQFALLFWKYSTVSKYSRSKLTMLWQTDLLTRLLAFMC